MAVQFADELSAALVDDFLPRAIDNKFKATPLLNRLYARRGQVVSDPYRVPLILQHTGNFAAYKDYDAIALVPERHIDDAKLSLAKFRDAVVISEAEADLSRAAGPKQVVDLLRVKSDILVRSFMEKLSAELYSANDASATTVLGLRRIVSAAAADTVGGISTSDYAAWAPAKTDTTTTLASLTATLIEQMIGAITDTGNRPDVAVMTQKIWDKVSDIYYQAVYRVVNELNLRAGWSAITIRGVDFMPDPQAPANHMFIFDSSALDVKVHPLHDMRRMELPRDPRQWIVGATLDIWIQVMPYQRRAFAAFTALS